VSLPQTSLYIGPELLKEIDRARGEESRSSFVRRMISKAMGIDEPKLRRD